MIVEKEIIKILREEILQDESFQIDSEADLLTTGTLDSMALVRLVAAIEAKYKIKIPPTDLVIENFLNIQSIQAYVLKRIGNQ
jgi:acyl carrier protein